MKIAEVIASSYIDDEVTRATPTAALMQQIAAAFTPSGRVKAHWDAPRFGGEQEPEPKPVSRVTSTAVLPSVARGSEVQSVDNAVPKSGLEHSDDSFQNAVAPDSALGSSDSRWR